MAVNAQTARTMTREQHNYRFVILGVVWTSYLIVYLSRLSVGPLAPVNLGIVVGPPAFGYLVDATGSYRASWVLMAGCAGVSVVTVSLVHEPRAGRSRQSVAAHGEGN